jgi:RNA polymerase sigma-70 factor, ECF subfamily
MRTSHFAPFKKLLGISDEQLMWRTAMQDDEAAFTRLVNRWQSPIYRLCIRMIGDPHRAEDLSQETFSRVFSQRKAYQPGRRFTTWLWRIALNACYDELRRRQRRNELSSDPTDELASPALVAPEPSPDRNAARAEEGRLVRRALDALPESYRVVLVLHHYQDMKFREIAEVLGIPEGTVKSRMAEALSQLSQQLKQTLEIDAPAAIRPATRSRPKAMT